MLESFRFVLREADGERQMKRAAILTILALSGLLSGCALTAEQRVRQALVDAGLQPPVAGCMAGKMTRKLSTDQLRELHAAVKAARGPDGRTSLKAIKRQLSTVNPVITYVVTRAAITCELKAG